MSVMMEGIIIEIKLSKLKGSVYIYLNLISADAELLLECSIEGL